MKKEELKNLRIGDKVRLRGNQDGIVFKNEIFEIKHIFKDAAAISINLGEHKHTIAQWGDGNQRNMIWNVDARHIQPLNTYTKKELLKEIYHDLEKIL